MQNQVYPGIFDNSLEFFTINDQVSFFQSGKFKSIIDLPNEIIEKIEEVIATEEGVADELESLHPFSKWSQIETFVKCRYGGLDFSPDMSNGELKRGDYWDCPLRGICKSEGTLCKVPEYKGQELTFEEVNLIKLLTTTRTNEAIASDMNTPLGSFHLLKRNLYQKLQIQTKQELTIIAVRLNFINV